MSSDRPADLMERLVNLCKRRGFVFPSSELYGGIGGFYDFGHFGVLLKKRIEERWWKTFLQSRSDIVAVESSIIMNPKVWEVSGHVKNFTDPLVECKVCHERFRADQDELLKNHKHQGTFTESRPFHTMFKTFVGPVEDAASVAYLRPENAQGMFTNYLNVLDTARVRVPFGIAQIGKSFRNEITFRNFLFRMREFTIAEVEYFVKPGDDEKAFDDWLLFMEHSLTKDFGIAQEHLRRHEHSKDTLAHYSKRTVDLHYHYPWGWDELWGLANRTDYDLRQHAEASGKKMEYRDPVSGETFVPYVIEPTGGVERLFLAVLTEHFSTIKGGRTTTTESTKEEEVVLKFPQHLAPVQVAVLPLSKKDPLPGIAKELAAKLRRSYSVDYDEVASIGRRYRRQDEIGTPYCVTVDFDTVADHHVTIRDRDSMTQERVPTTDLPRLLTERFSSA